MSAPMIGISTYREPADWGSWRQVRADLLPAAYAEAVVSGGGVPVLLPPTLDKSAAARAISRIDGLIVAGGADLDPATYGAAPESHTAGWRPDRDSSELALLAAADAADTPTLGICRGMQMMAAYAGGTVRQHVPDLVGDEKHSPGPGIYGEVSVRVEPDSALAKILESAVTVPCHHHQSVDTHPGFHAAAYAADGLLEAMADPRRRFRIAVQWHPEVGDDMSLFAALVDAAR